MTNFEKYKDVLMKMNGDFAVDKNSKKIAECNTLGDAERGIDCVDCIFYDESCFDSDKLKWLYSEYEEPILSNDELELINILSKINGKEYKYIYRNGNYVFIFSDKQNINKCGMTLDESDYIEITGRTDLFSNIKSEHGLYDIKNKCFIEA